MTILLDNFETLITCAEDVPRLNEAILQLAVQGKLVAQDPADEPASELLKRITAEKRRLVKEGKISKSKTLTEVSEEEKLFNLPEGWEWVRLGTLAQNIHYGYTASADFQKEEYRLLRITDIQNNKVNWPAVPGCEIREKDVNKYLFDNDDILIARTGGTVGKSYLVENISVNAIFASYLIRVIPSSELFAKYIKLFLDSPLYWGQLIERSQGTGQPNVNATSLAELQLPLPSLEEQKRIVERVDMLLGQTRRLEAEIAEAEEALTALHNAAVQDLLTATDADDFADKWQFMADNFDAFYDEVYPEAAQANVAELKQVILQLAVQGKLTCQCPDDEPAAVLLERISAEKKRLGIKSTKLPEIGEGERPYVPIELLCETRGGIQKSKNRRPNKNPVRYLTVAHVQRNWIDFSDPRYFEVVPEELNKWKLIPGDNLIVEGNGSAEHIGRTAIFNGEIDECVHQNHLIRVRPNRSFLVSEYLNIFLNSPEGRSEMLERSRTTSGLYNLSVGRIKSICIPIFSLEEQKRIVGRVDALFNRCDELAAHLQLSQSIRTALRDAVLAEL